MISERKPLEVDWYTKIKCSIHECERYCEGVIYKQGEELETAYGWCPEHVKTGSKSILESFKFEEAK